MNMIHTLSFIIGSPTVQQLLMSVIHKVTGVGNLKTKAKGRGIVELISWCNHHKYILQLENVLYIPTNRNNLISLGKWDQDVKYEMN